MTVVRLFPVLFLALMLCIGAVQAAAMRLQAPAAGSITICSGAGMVTLHLDASGQPTAPPHLCPDCTAALAAGLADAPVSAPQAPFLRAEVLALPVARAVPPRPLLHPQARGPPRLV